ncbi:glutamate-cysteine ligase family protein [Actinoplanes sp. NPDC051343]|uniref:glutamate-cysteine ligase family protein n=1 Tax=Actinoplanes sp. NPDC051343 TaxID=3363906 RepID=UPI0037B88330
MQRLTPAQLRAPFTPTGGTGTGQDDGRIGLEIECGIVRPITGAAVPYGGADGIESILLDISQAVDGVPQFLDGHLYAMQCPDGTRLSLEPGGAIEYSSPPEPDLIALVDHAMTALQLVAKAAAGRDAAVLCDALLPFTELSKAPWIPNRRVWLMREWWEERGAAGEASKAISVLTTSTQLSFDFDGGRDFTEKVRMQMAVSPIVAALCVNSPLAEGRLTGVASRRMELLLAEDPERSGFPSFAMKPDLGIDDFVAWALSRPMLYRYRNGHYGHAPKMALKDAMSTGFPDGTFPTDADWASQQSQLWPFVRPRHTLEVRLADGPPYPYFGALAALWTGLTYHPESRDSAWRLMRDRSQPEQMELTAEVAKTGLEAFCGPRPVRDVAIELVELARAGIEARIRAGRENRRAVKLLEPFADILRTGVTFAEQKQKAWNGELGGRPDRYVEAYRVPVG